MRNIQGLFFRHFKNDYIITILKELYVDKLYDPYFTERKKVVLDIGANVGLFSYYASDKADTIYAFEPSKEHLETLIQMVSFNNLTNVYPVDIAVASFNGKAPFYHNGNTTIRSLKDIVNSEPDETEEVQCSTLDKIFTDLKLTHVDFMKLDVEGSECDILASKGFDMVADKIDTIVGEYHRWCGVSMIQFENMIRDRDYEFKWLEDIDAKVWVAKRLKK